MTELQRLVQSAEFAAVFASEQQASTRAGQTSVTLRLLKGLQSQAQGGSRRLSADERIAKKFQTASGCAPRQMTGVTDDGRTQQPAV